MHLVSTKRGFILIMPRPPPKFKSWLQGGNPAGQFALPDGAISGAE